MQTIEVTDEMYNALVELAKVYTTQDNRGTRMPYLFQVRDYERKYYHDSNQGNFPCWVEEGAVIETFEELIDYLDEIDFKYTEIEKNTINLMWENYHTEYVFRDEDIYIDDFIEKYCPELKQMSYDIVPIYTNAFFTAKGCKEHIQANKHHYNEPSDYLNYADRNSEMELISNFLCELAKIEGK